MGILDEAIREHLELKRQHGAEDSELKQLEDEAFGPPARPGDAEQAAAPEGQEAEAPEAGSEAPTEFLPEAGVEAPPEPAEPLVEEHQAAEHEAVPPASEPPPAEAAEQPTQLYDVEGELAAEEAPPEQPLEAQITAEDDFFDEQSLSEELDQALEGSEEDEAAPPAAEEDEAVVDDAAPAPEEEEEQPPPEEPASDPPDFDEPAFADEEGEGEDVLEETPEFLQDTPESDRLWFEQKPPKDFDFDD